MPEGPWIESPPALFAFLASIVACIFWLSQQPALQRFFRYFPALIWTYFVPMACSTLGIIPNTSPLYGPVMLYVVLPAVIVLLLVPSETRAIARLGGKAVAMMLIGTLGIVLGAGISFGLFTVILPAGTFAPDTWKGIAALSGSWIGGSPNMAAVAGSLGTDPTLLGKMVVVDTVCAYTWLGVLIALIGVEKHIDRFNRADSSIIHELAARLSARHAERARPLRLPDFTLMIGLAFAVSQLCLFGGKLVAAQVDAVEAASGFMARVNLSEVLSAFGWGILLTTGAAIVLSFTRMRDLDDAGAMSVGYGGLYLLLTTFGAQADLRLIEADDLWLFAVGATWLLIHIVVLALGGRLLRVPFFMVATASMANVGGTASAPVVAAAFHPSLAAVGLLMAILGGIIGTPVALLVVGKMAAAIASGGG
ncbi:MAG: DUF819 family protein [Phycisphaerae bacterium]|nr:DUF819 family protein [Phycisphaerae bacterium]